MPSCIRFLAISALATAGCAYHSAGQQLTCFRGLLHSHTHFSDGSGTPNDAYEMARNAGLDFFAITEHNHNQAAGSDGVFLTPTNYAQLKLAAASHTVDGTFVALFGQEVSTISSGNHVNIFNASEICDIANGDFEDLYERWLIDHPEVPFIQMNHPDVSRDQSASEAAHKRNNDYGIDDYGQDFSRLVAAADTHIALMEMIVGPAMTSATDKVHQNGSHQDDYLFYLNEGFHIGVSVGQDNHKFTWGLATEARLGCWAEELTKESIYEALGAMRTFASEDENLEVWFEINGTEIGGEAATDPSGNCLIRVEIDDPDEPEATYRIRLFYDDAVGGDEAIVIEDQDLHGVGDVAFSHAPLPGGYYFVRITQESDHNDDVWTSPIWITDAVKDDAIASSNTDDPQLDEIEWWMADDYIGLTVTVSGEIVRAYKARTVLFLNFDSNYNETISLVVLDDDWSAFGGPEAIQERMMGKQVRVRGEITIFNDRMQMLLREPAQILEIED